MKNLNDIENDIKNLKGLKGNERDNSVKELSLNLHSCLKRFGFISVEKGLINSLFENHISERRTKNELIKTMRTNNLIYDGYKNKPCKVLRNREVESYFNKKGECIVKNKNSLCLTKTNNKIKVYFLK